MRIAQVNMVDYGSTGKIMFQIAECARSHGHEVKTYSMKWRNNNKPIFKHTYFGYFWENAIHVILSKTFGFHGRYSYFGTKQLVRELSKYKPDILHLHNLHNYCINIPVLFEYIKREHVRVVWTLHDCWAFTGQCSYFAMVKCDRWKAECCCCPQLPYKMKALIDCSRPVFKKKRELFTAVDDMVLVTPSEWLASLVKQSFLKDFPLKVINNGVDLSVFKPTPSGFRSKLHCDDKYIVLGVALGWGMRKGLDVFIKLSKLLDSAYRIVLIGTSEAVDKQLPSNIISIHRTQNQAELAEIYSSADVFINPTREDNFPTTNIESLACGTPVVTFNTGGSPEIPDENCGSVVPLDDVQALVNEVKRVCTDKPYSQQACLERAKRFDMNDRFTEYVNLYENLLNRKA